MGPDLREGKRARNRKRCACPPLAGTPLGFRARSLSRKSCCTHLHRGREHRHPVRPLVDRRDCAARQPRGGGAAPAGGSATSSVVFFLALAAVALTLAFLLLEDRLDRDRGTKHHHLGGG